jgi:hypothetical protein
MFCTQHPLLLCMRGLFLMESLLVFWFHNLYILIDENTYLFSPCIVNASYRNKIFVWIVARLHMHIYPRNYLRSNRRILPEQLLALFLQLHVSENDSLSFLDISVPYKRFVKRTRQSTPWSGVIYHNLIVAQLLKWYPYVILYSITVHTSACSLTSPEQLYFL